MKNPKKTKVKRKKTKNPKKKKKEKKMLKSKMKKKKNPKKWKKSRKSLLNLKFKIKPNPSGWENPKPLLKKNTPLSINLYPTIGKTTLPVNNSQLKDNSNSKLSYSSPKEPPSTYSKPKKRRTISNYTLEEYSSWMIVKIWSPTVSASLRVSSTPKISPWIFPENSYNKIKSSRSSKKTSLKNASNFSPKLLKTLKTTKNSTNNFPKT